MINVKRFFFITPYDQRAGQAVGPQVEMGEIFFLA